MSKRYSSSALITAANFINIAQIGEGAKILDLGCGHGRITELLVSKVPSLDVVGVDMTRSLLEKFVVESGVNGSKLKLICADIASLPLEDNRFDVAVSSRVFQYLPDPVCGVREALRVLKPGGRLVVSIPNKLNMIKYFGYRSRLYSPFEVRDWFRNCGFYKLEYGSMCFFPSATRWKRFAAFWEIGTQIPFIKYVGGNVVVKGQKKMEQPSQETRGSQPQLN